VSAPQWRGVFFDGPQADQDRAHDFKTATVLAQRTTKDRHLELIHEATTA
jgi:hypothetical protein